MPLPSEFDLLITNVTNCRLLYNPKIWKKNLRVSHQEIEGVMGMSRQHWWDPWQFSQMIHASHSQCLLEIAQSGSYNDRVWSIFLQLLCWFVLNMGTCCAISRIEVAGFWIIMLEMASTIRGPTGDLPLCTVSLSMLPDFVKRLYQALLTFLEGMLFLQWRRCFDLNLLLTITTYLDSCIHNVHWAFI